jgi:dolichol kinase
MNILLLCPFCIPKKKKREGGFSFPAFFLIFFLYLVAGAAETVEGALAAFLAAFLAFFAFLAVFTFGVAVVACRGVETVEEAAVTVAGVAANADIPTIKPRTRKLAVNFFISFSYKIYLSKLI